MRQSDEQWLFLQDVAKLVNFAKSQGFKLTGGELQRPLELQQIYKERGSSKTLNSLHIKKLAIDLNVFLKVTPDNWASTYSKKDVQPLGDFWEALDEKNKWGGNWKTFKDVPHFERKI